MPARDDWELVNIRILERFPERVGDALEGNRDALANLLLIAADVAWQSRAESIGSIEMAATRIHRYMDAVADCYSADRPPSGQMCDDGFALASLVDAIAVELLVLRKELPAGRHDHVSAIGRAYVQDARHLARAHLAALRDSVGRSRAVTAADVEAAEGLYAAVVNLERAHERELTLRDLGDTREA